MNTNAVTLTPGTKPSSTAKTQYDLLTHKILFNSQNQLRIVDTEGGAPEETFDLTGGGHAIGVVSGYFCVGTIAFNGPTITQTITLENDHDKVHFQHHTLSNVFGGNVDSAPGVDIELVGADDDRYLQAQASISVPQLHRFLLSQCFVHLRIIPGPPDDTLEITFQANTFGSGYWFLIST